MKNPLTRLSAAVAILVCSVPVALGAPYLHSKTAPPTVSPDGVNRTPLDDNAFCSDLLTIVRCQIDDLKKRKKDAEDTAAKLKALKDLQKENADAGIKCDLTVEIKKASSAADDAARKFTDDDGKELDRLGEKLDYVVKYCAEDGWPAPWYSLRIGVEGTWQTDRSLSNGKPLFDFYFASPLIYLRTPNARVKAVVICRGGNGVERLRVRDLAGPTPCADHEVETSFPRRLLDLEQGNTVAVRCALQEARDAVTAAEASVTAATKKRDELSTKDKQNQSAIQELQGEIENIPDPCTSSSECSTRNALVRLLTKRKKSAEKSGADLREAQKDLDVAQKTLADARTNQSSAEKADGTCNAVSGVEALIRAFDLRRTTDEKDPAGIVGTRVGPYVIPDRLKLQSSPIWVYTRLRSELIPDVSKAGVKPDDPTYASKAIENANTRPTIAVGGYYSWTIGKALVLGPYLQAGSVVGDLPDSRGSFTDHLFYGAGFSMQTNYAVADIDVQKKVATVVGVLNAGYGYERFLGRYTPDLTKPDMRVATEDAARLQVEARLNWSKLDSKAIKPFVFLALDRSIHGSLHRDRGGILFDVDLDSVFGSAVDSAAKTAGVSTSSTSK